MPEVIFAHDVVDFLRIIVESEMELVIWLDFSDVRSLSKRRQVRNAITSFPTDAVPAAFHVWMVKKLN